MLKFLFIRLISIVVIKKKKKKGKIPKRLLLLSLVGEDLPSNEWDLT